MPNRNCVDLRRRIPVENIAIIAPDWQTKIGYAEAVFRNILLFLEWWILHKIYKIHSYILHKIHSSDSKMV